MQVAKPTTFDTTKAASMVLQKQRLHEQNDMSASSLPKLTRTSQIMGFHPEDQV